MVPSRAGNRNGRWVSAARDVLPDRSCHERQLGNCQGETVQVTAVFGGQGREPVRFSSFAFDDRRTVLEIMVAKLFFEAEPRGSPNLAGVRRAARRVARPDRGFFAPRPALDGLPSFGKKRGRSSFYGLIRKRVASPFFRPFFLRPLSSSRSRWLPQAPPRRPGPVWLFRPCGLRQQIIRRVPTPSRNGGTGPIPCRRRRRPAP
jgi:hypothetical protein